MLKALLNSLNLRPLINDLQFAMCVLGVGLAWQSKWQLNAGRRVFGAGSPLSYPGSLRFKSVGRERRMNGRYFFVIVNVKKLAKPLCRFVPHLSFLKRCPGKWEELGCSTGTF